MTAPVLPPASPTEIVPGSLRVLVVDDDRTLREGTASVLQMDGHAVTATGRGEEALDLVRRRKFDLVLVDLYMTPISGTEVLRACLDTHRDTIVVVMTGNPSVASSIEALRMGAWDYLPKPFSASHLQVLVGRAAHAVGSAREAREAAAGATGIGSASGRPPLVTQSGAGDLMALLGDSSAFRRAVDLAQKVAATDASVMISGESGTGKEMFAQFIHRHSRRAQRKLVPVNCAALPEHLLESEMFGYRKGAFTGADRDKAGLLEVANGGTLFLDELTEMTMPLQAKLLRVLQDGVVRRLGSETHDAVVDVRFISATNREPADAVKTGLLREDLFYRLRVVPIKLPPLRQRTEDIPLLASFFLTNSWQRHRAGSPAPNFSDEAIDFLCSRPWRGNVRELQNVIEHVAVIADAGQAIRPDDITALEDGSALAPEAAPAASITSAYLNEPFHTAKDRLVAHFEKEYLARLTTRAAGNMSKAARLAGIDRTTLYRLLEKHEIRRDGPDGE
jgi:DNA-binding NtrC family response regulator